MTFNRLEKVVFACLMCAVLLLGLFPGLSAQGEEFPQETENGNIVRVSTVDEFLAAIAPNTEIVLAPGEYNLTQAKGYGRTGGKYYH